MKRFENGDRIKVVGSSKAGAFGTYEGGSGNSLWPHRVRLDKDRVIPYCFADNEIESCVPDNLLYDMKHRVRISGNVPEWMQDDEDAIAAFHRFMDRTVQSCMDLAGRKIIESFGAFNDIKVEVD